MKQHKPHIKELGCYKQAADVIGEANAQKELWKVVHCDDVLSDLEPERGIWSCFCWVNTPQGHNFWSKIEKGVNPYEQ